MMETYETIDAYIDAQSADIRDILRTTRQTIRDAAPEAIERICMRMPTFDLNGQWLVHFGAFKKHMGFFPQPDGVEAFKARLAGYKTSKGTVQFTYDKPIPYDLIAEITRFRVKAIKESSEGGVGDVAVEKQAVVVPEELTAVLANDAEARAFFEQLTDGYKRGYCDWVGGAKQAATRETRAGKALLMLQNKQKTLKT